MWDYRDPAHERALRRFISDRNQVRKYVCGTESRVTAILGKPSRVIGAERCNVIYHSSITFLGMNRNYLTLVKHNPTP